MKNKIPRCVAAQLDVIPFEFEVPPGDLDWVRCNRCDTHLSLHQPDLQSPSRLLGICDGCRRWYLVLMEPGLKSAIMVVVQEDKAFLSTWDPGVESV